MLKRAISQAPEFARMFVRGEISNLSRPASGHVYFTLKDDRSRLRVVMFASRARLLRFQLQDGMNVVVQGGIDIFERLGDYQLYAESAEPDGLGALYLAFEQLKERLEREGLFAATRKRALPPFPTRIALVTSRTGAAVRDMITTLSRRYPLAQLYVVPVAVQGEEAPVQIARGIELVWRYRLADVMIVGRGGGSLEELFAFNSEVVARAIAASPIPVVSAVGHETDTTIADFVADVRAATPTAAAELVAPDIRELQARVTVAEQRLRRVTLNLVAGLRDRLQRAEQSRALIDPLRYLGRLHERIDRIEPRLRLSLRELVEQRAKAVNSFELRLARHSPREQITLLRLRLDRLQERQWHAVQKSLERAERGVQQAITSLELLSPLAVMKRGYAVTYRAMQSAVITSVSQVQPGDSLHVQMIDGWLDCQVWGVYDRDESSK